MIADTIYAVVPNAYAVSVDIQCIRWSDREKGLRYVYLTPATAQIALVEFDQGVEPQPFSFQLRNGQVTPMYRNAKTAKSNKQERIAKLEAKLANKTITEAERRGLGVMKANVARAEALRKAKVVPDEDRRTVSRQGGRRPPMAALANNRKGQRRIFGLRSLDRARVSK
jgi:hypothetical protein